MKEFFSTLILLLIGAASIIILSTTMILIEWFYQMPYFTVFVLIYIVLGGLTLFLQNKKTHILLKILGILIFAPIALIFVLIKSAQPVFVIIVAVLLFFALSSLLPISIEIINKSLDSKHLNEDIITLIVWSGTSSMAIIFFRPISEIVKRLLRYYSSEKLNNSYIPRITGYLITIENVRMVIYAWFFIYLTAYSIQLFRETDLVIDQFKDQAILNSFLIFLALDRVILYSKKVPFKSSNLLSRVLVSIRKSMR